MKCQLGEALRSKMFMVLWPHQTEIAEIVGGEMLKKRRGSPTLSPYFGWIPAHTSIFYDKVFN